MRPDRVADILEACGALDLSSSLSRDVNFFFVFDFCLTFTIFVWFLIFFILQTGVPISLCSRGFCINVPSYEWVEIWPLQPLCPMPWIKKWIIEYKKWEHIDYKNLELYESINSGNTKVYQNK